MTTIADMKRLAEGATVGVGTIKLGEASRAFVPQAIECLEVMAEALREIYTLYLPTSDPRHQAQSEKFLTECIVLQQQPTYANQKQITMKEVEQALAAFEKMRGGE